MAKYQQKQRDGGYEVNGSQLAEEDAQHQAHPTPTTSHTDEVLADIDEALQGLDEDLGVTYRQQGGQ